MRDDTYRGEKVRTLPRRNRTYEAGRTCEEVGCATRLSIYNRSKRCWQHEPVRTFVARGKRRRRDDAAA